MISLLKESPLFAHMTEKEIEDCLKCSNSKAGTYEKDVPIFLQQDEPEKLFVLIKGSVTICHDSASGKRAIIATLRKPGELFGEVFLFLNEKKYDNYAIAAERTEVLLMPKEFLQQGTGGEVCSCRTTLISNMLSILAQKAFYLNRKLQILSTPTLRQKISRILLQNENRKGTVTLKMNREELAEYLNVARPSLSRELMKMQADGLLLINGKKITVSDWQALRSSL